jgi:hypothetical protein
MKKFVLVLSVVFIVTFRLEPSAQPANRLDDNSSIEEITAELQSVYENLIASGKYEKAQELYKGIERILTVISRRK